MKYEGVAVYVAQKNPRRNDRAARRGVSLQLSYRASLSLFIWPRCSLKVAWSLTVNRLRTAVTFF